MNNSKNNNSFYVDNSIHSQSQVEYSPHKQKAEELIRAYDEALLFYETFEKVKEQIEFKCFSTDTQATAENICLIITEVLKLPPNALIRISGNNLPAEIVQAIYYRLTHEHIKLVIKNFGRATYEIKHKKTYLRTALYNSVFEIDAHYENAVNIDNPQFVKEPYGTRRGEYK